MEKIGNRFEEEDNSVDRLCLEKSNVIYSVRESEGECTISSNIGGNIKDMENIENMENQGDVENTQNYIIPTTNIDSNTLEVTEEINPSPLEMQTPLWEENEFIWPDIHSALEAKSQKLEIARKLSDVIEHLPPYNDEVNHKMRKHKYF